MLDSSQFPQPLDSMITVKVLYILRFLFFWLCCMAYGTWLLAVKAQKPNH